METEVIVVIMYQQFSRFDGVFFFGGVVSVISNIRKDVEYAVQ